MHSPGRGIHGQLSSPRFEAVFSVFSTGAACLPAAGLGAVPEQMAAALPSRLCELSLRTRVARLRLGLGLGLALGLGLG